MTSLAVNRKLGGDGQNRGGNGFFEKKAKKKSDVFSEFKIQV